MSKMVVVQPKELIYFLQLSSKSSFWKVDDVFPECLLYREHAPRIDPLICIKENTCHVGHNCMEILVKRVHALFDEVVPKYVNLILLYFKKRNTNGIGAGVFWRDFRTPRIITLNPGGWRTVKARGEVFRFTPGESFFLSGRTLPPELDSNTVKAVLL